MGKPRYIAIAAVTLDGKIAKTKSHMSTWTSKEDKLFMRALLNKCDAIIVGNNTYKTAIKPLSKRNCIVLSRSANKLISKSSGLTRGVYSPPFKGGARGGYKPRLEYCNPKKSDLKKLIRDRGYKRIAILGGAQTYAYCLKNNLLDELYLTIEPIVFGKGINLFESRKFLEQKFKLDSIKKLNRQGSLLLHYKK
jgi:dihydrofolate reductase